MRVLMAVVLCAAGLLALDAPADSAPRYKRIAKKQQAASKQRPTRRERVECANARNFDPTGQFKGYPCWAREAFGRASKTLE